MCGDLGIRPLIHSELKILQREIQIPAPVMYPAQTVQDERIPRQQRQCLFDQLQCFGQSIGFVCEGVAQRIVGMRIIGIDLDEPAHVLLMFFHTIHDRSHQSPGVKQVRVIRNIDQRRTQQFQR